jgi:hypothetical protein
MIETVGPIEDRYAKLVVLLVQGWVSAKHAEI